MDRDAAAAHRERLTVDAGLRQLNFLGEELVQIDAIIAQQVLGDEDVRRLMTIPGIDIVIAATLVAVIGDVQRFPTTRHLVGYLGLHPTIRQSGNGPARHGRVSKEGSAAARHVLVEAAWSAAQEPRAATRIRPRHRRQAWTRRRDRRRCAQTRRARMAAAHARRGLRIRAPKPRAPQAARARACGRAHHAPSQAPTRPRLEQHQRGCKTPRRRAGRDGLPTRRR